ncbi:MAG TPA: DNA-processing protein DprA [Solirubrobacteraceae bacterium]|jgi:DNA processing protein
MSAVAACFACLRRTWLVARLAGRIECERRGRSGELSLLLALEDERLMRAVRADGRALGEYRMFDAHRARAAIDAAGLGAVCRHDDRYPAALGDLPDPPAVVHVAGDLDLFAALTAAGRPAVAVVGARKASAYGLEAARALGRGLAAADAPVISGLALGADSAAHAGAVEVGGPTIAVLAGGAERAYPRSKLRLYDAVRRHGAVISEMPPGFTGHRWSFPARNRLIAALARVTVVVEAAERSGSLITAELARDLGREVAAVPGRVTSPLAVGTNALLKDGAALVAEPRDVLDLACGVGSWTERERRDQVPGHLRALLSAVADGRETLDALVAAGHGVGEAMAGLAELEVLGHVRRAVGGRFVAAA